IAGLEQQLREREEASARLTADLETERGERRRLEQRASTLAVQLQELHKKLTEHLQTEEETQNRIAGLEQQLREREEALVRVTADLETERGERRQIEQRALTLSAQLQELHNELTEHLQVEADNTNRILGLEQQLRERGNALARVTADLETE